ncbi:MAG: UDP-N-acetylglucosamine 4,6-dehydratase (inverting) [Nitrospiraceae bacterium]|nr:UDP-N-acetylglucosamine 4,6-dehydratase (inverting) [Nitrospiraceae bacterium]
MFDDKVILITGGTGSFGKKFSQMLFSDFSPKKLIIFSRDEFKQFEMSKTFSPEKYPIRFFLGDIRDKDRLTRAFDGVDYVIHAAALKQVPALEYNPLEAVKTNIIGAGNIVDVAIDRNVKKVIALSTDKAVTPVNLYGATKLAMEKIFIAANAYAGAHQTRFSMVRYGNVIGSRGSVIPYFLQLLANGAKELPVTDMRMTRFWLTLSEGVALVSQALADSVGGEIFIPKIPSMRIRDLVEALCPDCAVRVVGIRPGEKLHETLIAKDEARTTIDTGDKFVILSPFEAADALRYVKYKSYPFVGEDFAYSSDSNDRWMAIGELRSVLEGAEFK